MKKFQHLHTVLALSFVCALSFSLGNELGAEHFLAKITDITVIPKSGSVSDAFQTGDFDFKDILDYGMYLIKLGGILAGVMYMLMNVWAGIRYITGSISAEEEEAKNTMINALIGFSIAVFSWIFVDILLALVT